MKIRFYILSLLLSSLFLSQAFAVTGGNAIYPDAEIQQAGRDQSGAAATHNQNFLFSAHQQSERAIHLSSNNTLLSAESLTEEDSCRTHTSEKNQRWSASNYLERSKSMEISFTIKKRIFPFHSYL